ncbi:hypothetical protein GOP47_0028895 [Adiantum capillus-veneris]|nr:hypothetical protein GOP47_0028895 [Adiantum capillus-veneris]
MEPLAPPLKKSRPDFLSNGGNLPSSFPLHAPAGDKRFPSSESFLYERESFGTSVGSKSKACLKFFSTSGCPYGESCHFSHYVPGGVAALGLPQASSLAGSGSMGLRKESSVKAGLPMPPMMPMRNREQGPMPTPSAFKSRLCSNFETVEGCRFGPKCHFAHGEHELRKSTANPDTDMKSFDRFQPLGLGGGVSLEDKFAFSRHREPTPPGLAAAASFGAISTAKVSIDASLAGIIIGKGGVNAKAISRATGAKLFIRDHESDSSLKNVEMEGSLDQIKLASGMVRELLANKDVLPTRPTLAPQTYKSKLCDNFPKGTCKYGDRCHFAHSQSELQLPAPS